MEDIKNGQSICPPPYNRKAFTLSEVLITLVIIGIIAAITIPSINTSIQERELDVQAKKTYTTILNALKKVQLEESLIGDNSATFSGEGVGNGSYDKLLPAQRLASQMNVMKFCPKGSSDSVCQGLEKYQYKSYSEENTLTKDTFNKELPKIVLNDGSFIVVDARRCGDIITVPKSDEYGNINNTETVQSTQPCGFIFFDVNRAKAPNVVAKDVYHLQIGRTGVVVPNYKPFGGDRLSKIITNSR